MFEKIRMRLRPVDWALVGMVFFGAGGCGGGGAPVPELAPVTGSITLDGQPLSSAQVVFEPQGEGTLSVAKTDDSGHYELYYNAENPGAVPGSHVVRISKYGEPGSPNDTMDQIPPQYNQGSTLTADVKAGEGNVFDFELESR